MPSISELKMKLDELSTHIPYLRNIEISNEWIIDKDNPLSFPNSEFPGVYFFTDFNEEVIYIGKASSGLGSRLGAYIGKENIKKDQKIDEAKSIFTIKIEKDLFFLAPAIEEFLIYSLNPKINRIGKAYISHIQD